MTKSEIMIRPSTSVFGFLSDFGLLNWLFGGLRRAKKYFIHYPPLVS